MSEISTPDYLINVQDSPSSDWDDFVHSAPDSSLYHLSAWTHLAKVVFGHRTLFLEARTRPGVLVGILPLVHQRSLLLGSFTTSVAFFNYGGALTRQPEIGYQLMQRASEVGQVLGSRYVEFRDTKPRPGPWLLREDKTTLLLDLPPTVSELSRGVGSKVRSQIRRAEREAVTCRHGTHDLVPDFYTVFAENMHDLGTPVYPLRFFEAIVQSFPSQCDLLVVDWRGKPSAAAFLVRWRDTVEIPWAACRTEAKPIGLNMKLYWEALSLAVNRGFKRFDFGRSTIDSGTYRFKRQWGANPAPLYWYRWERRPRLGPARPVEARGKLQELGTRLWRRIPLPVANRLGALISGGLPW